MTQFQYSLPGIKPNAQKSYFGGSHLKGNARSKRPLSTKEALHLVLRSSKARGTLSFLSPKRAKRIKDCVFRQARQKHLKIYRYANSGNHLHIILLPRTREAYRCFIRAISGLISRMTQECERGRPCGEKTPFWDKRPFSRIIAWGRDFKSVAQYVERNVLEAVYIARKPELKRVRI